MAEQSNIRPNPSGPRGPDDAKPDTNPEQTWQERAYSQWINKVRKLSLAEYRGRSAKTSSRPSVIPRQVRSDG